MGWEERRGNRRIACTSLATFDIDGTETAALVADVSLHGLRLVGDRLPSPGTELTISVLAPSPISVIGRVRWQNPWRGAGIDLAGGDRDRAFARALLSFAFEVDSNRPVIAMIVEDPALAARLCEPVRSRGFIPHVLRTPLEAISYFEHRRSPVWMALVAPRVWNMCGAEILSFMSDEYPDTICVAIGDASPTSSSLIDHHLHLEHASTELANLFDRLASPDATPRDARRRPLRRRPQPRGRMA